MLKADYAALAKIISDERALHKKVVQNKLAPETARAECHGAFSELGYLARSFAKVASVNETEFLKACGIKP